MIWKNGRYCLSASILGILAGLAGAIALGCTSSTNSSVQETDQGSNSPNSPNSPNIPTPERVEGASQGQNNSTTAVTSKDAKPNQEIAQQNSSSQQITNGFYALGGTDQGLEVQNQRYRYYDELGSQEWRSISGLTYIKKGVVFDGENYWCLSTLAPQNEPGICSENGWKRHQDVLKEESSPLAKDELSVAGIVIGDEEQTIRRKFGEPNRVVEPLFTKLEYPGLTIWLHEDNLRVDMIRSTSPQYCTPSGVCPGMNFSNVRKIYGEPIVKDRENGRFMEYYSSNSTCWLQIALDQEVVKSVGVVCQP